MLHQVNPLKSSEVQSCKILAQRRHYDIIDHLMDNLPGSSMGRKKIDIPKPKSGVTYKFKPSVKVVDTKLKQEELETNLNPKPGKRRINFIPKPRFKRPELRHFEQERCKEEFRLRGLKAPILTASHTDYNEHVVEKTMQRKGRIRDYYERRNGLSATSLGDKSYKHCTYSNDFYQEPGVIPGSTNKRYQRNFAKKNEVDFNISPDAKYPFYPTTTWEKRVKDDRLKQELDDVDELEKWEETILKEHLGKNEPDEEEKKTRGAKGKKVKGKKKR